MTKRHLEEQNHMRNHLLLVTLISCLYLSCGNRLPDLPPEPRISFIALQPVVEEVTVGNVTVDTYNVDMTISYEDGDEDLGFASMEELIASNNSLYMRDSNGDYIKFGSSPGMPSFSCDDYRLWRADGSRNLVRGDTARINRGMRTANFIFDWLVEQPDGSYTQFNPEESQFFLSIGCFRDFDLYVTDVNEAVEPGVPYSIEPKNRRQGTIDIRFFSNVLPRVFENTRIKLQLQVFDRAGNGSNVIVSDPFIPTY